MGAGFVNGDSAAVVSGLVFSTPATVSSAAGEYVITPLGATATNYTLAFVNGTLRVIAPTVAVGTAPLPVITINQQPALTPALAVVRVGERLVLLPVDSRGGLLTAAGGAAPSLDARLALTLGEITGMPAFGNGTTVSTGSTVGGATGSNRPNLGGFELVTSFGGGVVEGGSSGGSSRISSAQMNEPGLFRESTVSMGGFNVVYHEALADARQQTASNTALGSSYREFSDSDNPQVNLVRAKIDRKSAEPAGGRSPQGAL